MIPPPLGPSAVGEERWAYVSLLRSQQTGRLYLGWTTDLRRRLCQHTQNQSPVTRGRGPYEVVYGEAYRHREEAMAREQLLKKHSNVFKQLKARLSRTLAMASSRAQAVGG